MKSLFKFLLVAILVSAFTGQIQAQTQAVEQPQKPKNLIIFIGDGMGVAQVYAGMTASGFKMVFPYFPVSGFSITYSLNNYVTDSAAGGTALSSGEKTNNGMLAMRPDSTMMKTILELAKKKGMATGVVSVTSVTHATPASFVTHALSRADAEDIAVGFTSGTADVFIGGGRKDFMHRSDSTDLTLQLRKMGYDVVFTQEDMNRSSSAKLAALLADGHMPYIADGRDTEYLADATSKAIEILSKNPNGFVLMVEGSLIDFAGHDNDCNKIIDEVLDMDRAVSEAYDFASADGSTLIVVTADHETGGLTLVDGSVAGKSVTGSFSVTHHTAVMVPVFAFGPGSAGFTGVHQNTELNELFESLLRLK